MNPMLVACLFILAPTFVTLLGLWLIQRIQGEHRKKSPISHKVSRYPGYSLVKKIEETTSQVVNYLMLLLLIPVVVVLAVLTTKTEAITATSIGLVGSCLFFGLGFMFFRLLRLSKTLKNYKLGLKGEQIVGNQLMELLRHGCHVFHDVPMDYENIDHVVVGPSGVFTIETKMRRKEEGEEDGHKLYYNGKRLRFGKITTSSPLEQAKRQGEFLSSLLGGMFKTGEVSPIVIYPGWWVEQEKGAVDVLVMNDKAAMNYLSKQPRKLDEETVNSIASFLKERCRDVEV